LTHSAPESVGNGGNHRSYQIVYDVQQLIPPDHLHVIVRQGDVAKVKRNVAQDVSHSAVRSSRWNAVKHAIRMQLKRIKSASENPYNLAVQNSFSINSYLQPGFLAAYENAVERIRPQIAIIDHVGFAPTIPVNARYGIQTIACPQNLESLDAPVLPYSRWSLGATTHNLANELAVFAQCRACLCISKVETALMAGLGYAADYYGYLPVGEIRDSLLRVRRNRQTTQQLKGLFLLPGSAFHQSTREGMLWLLHQIELNTLPEGIRIVVIGAQSHTLPTTAGVTALGWIDQEQLEHYLTVASGILVPQFQGFGTPTKVVEFAMAGIPIIASEHVMSTIDPLPNVRIVNRTWNAWRDAMCTLKEGSTFETQLPETTENRLIALLRQLT
jgi:hypothetical protein